MLILTSNNVWSDTEILFSVLRQPTTTTTTTTLTYTTPTIPIVITTTTTTSPTQTKRTSSTTPSTVPNKHTLHGISGSSTNPTDLLTMPPTISCPLIITGLPETDRSSQKNDFTATSTTPENRRVPSSPRRETQTGAGQSGL